jgi:NAD(P)H-flavin reductase
LAYAAELDERSFDFYAGFRTGSFALENIRPRSLVVATEDGSRGEKGRITDFFTPTSYSAVFACGPEPMLKAVAGVCIAGGGVPCFISMEKHMACGVGACLGCTVKTTRGNRRCCADGPIFNAREICFDE